MNEWEIEETVQERRVDAALMTNHTLWSDARTARLNRECLVAAIPSERPLAEQDVLNSERLRRKRSPARTG
jgi:hypothetical protein